jgi:hypothetical protein
VPEDRSRRRGGVLQRRLARPGGDLPGRRAPTVARWPGGQRMPTFSGR